MHAAILGLTLGGMSTRVSDFQLVRVLTKPPENPPVKVKLGVILYRTIVHNQSLVGVN